MSLLNERWHVGNVQRVDCAFLKAFRDSADCFKASKHEWSGIVADAFLTATKVSKERHLATKVQWEDAFP